MDDATLSLSEKLSLAHSPPCLRFLSLCTSSTCFFLVNNFTDSSDMDTPRQPSYLLTVAAIFFLHIFTSSSGSIYYSFLSSAEATLQEERERVGFH